MLSKMKITRSVAKFLNVYRHTNNDVHYHIPLCKNVIMENYGSITVSVNVLLVQWPIKCVIV